MARLEMQHTERIGGKSHYTIVVARCSGHRMKYQHTSESAEQIALIHWARLCANIEPRLRWLFAIPNGGFRNKVTAARLRKEGVLPGIADIFLPVSRNDKHGLWIEMKYGKNKCSIYQTAFLNAMKSNGYEVAICYSFEAAKKVICEYLDRKDLL